MKKFLLFASYAWEANGGMSDCIGKFSSYEEAFEVGQKMCKEYTFVSIYDVEAEKETSLKIKTKIDRIPQKVDLESTLWVHDITRIHKIPFE